MTVPHGYTAGQSSESVSGLQSGLSFLAHTHRLIGSPLTSGAGPSLRGLPVRWASSNSLYELGRLHTLLRVGVVAKVVQ
jgi:hypothetical protein